MPALGIGMGLMAVGAATGLYGTFMEADGYEAQGRADAARLRRQARLKRMQSKEIRARAAINLNEVAKQEAELKDEQAASLARYGISASSSSGLSVAMRTHSNAKRAMSSISREAEYNSNLALLEAEGMDAAAIDSIRLGRQRGRAAKIGGFSSLLFRGGSMALGGS